MYLCVLCGSQNKQRLFPYTRYISVLFWTVSFLQLIFLSPYGGQHRTVCAEQVLAASSGSRICRYLTYRQHYTGAAVSVNRRSEYRAHSIEINCAHRTDNTTANLKNLLLKTQNCLKKKYMLRSWAHKERARAGNCKSKGKGHPRTNHEGPGWV